MGEGLVLKCVNSSFTLGVKKDPRLTEEALRWADMLMILHMRGNKLGCGSRKTIDDQPNGSVSPPP